jgi:hypothetical protein
LRDGGEMNLSTELLGDQRENTSAECVSGLKTPSTSSLRTQSLDALRKIILIIAVSFKIMFTLITLKNSSKKKTPLIKQCFRGKDSNKRKPPPTPEEDDEGSGQHATFRVGLEYLYPPPLLLLFTLSDLPIKYPT